MKLKAKLFPFLIIYLLSSCGAKKEIAIPELQSITEAVYASGYVIPKNEYQVFSKAEGYLIKKLVQDGEEVKAGEPLFYLENEQQGSRYRNALEVYEMAKNNYKTNSPVLEELEKSMASAKKKLNFDSLQLVRFQNLLDNKATSVVEYDKVKLSYENARTEFQITKNRYDKIKNQLFIDLKNAESQLKIASDENSNSIIKSRIDGRLFHTLKNEGELIRRSELIATVGDKDSFYLQLNIDELDIEKVREGLDILVKIDAYPTKVFKAKVTKIYPTINKKDQSVRVDADFSETIPTVFSGLAAEANIITRHKEKALVIPRMFVFNEDSVWVRVNGKEEKVKIVKGLETLEKVEVIAGISEETELIRK
jgi:HlyD family secretion protein